MFLLLPKTWQLRNFWKHVEFSVFLFKNQPKQKHFVKLLIYANRKNISSKRFTKFSEIIYWKFVKTWLRRTYDSFILISVFYAAIQKLINQYFFSFNELILNYSAVLKTNRFLFKFVNIRECCRCSYTNAVL